MQLMDFVQSRDMVKENRNEWGSPNPYDWIFVEKIFQSYFLEGWDTRPNFGSFFGGRGFTSTYGGCGEPSSNFMDVVERVHPKNKDFKHCFSNFTQNWNTNYSSRFARYSRTI